MEHRPVEHDQKTRRVTYRQKVLQVYPDAHLTPLREVFRWVTIGNGYVVLDKLTAHPDDPPEYNLIDWIPNWTAREAWKRAWITTQRQMIEKLEK